MVESSVKAAVELQFSKKEVAAKLSEKKDHQVPTRG